MPASNPVLIQGSGAGISRSRSGPAPLFMIHDASGLVSAYFKLGPIGRPVYGLYDPNFEKSGLGGWQDVREMAEHYIRLIKRQHFRGPIMLGGWSFGGIIAVEIAHLLNTQGRGLTVSGILLLDTVYPLCERPEATKKGTAQYLPAIAGLCQQTQEKLVTALVRATCLADHWRVPEWTMPRSVCARAKMPFHGQPPAPPPVVLIRATGMVPMEDPETTCILDRTRFLPQLGWEDLHPEFISHVLPVEGNHYSIFDEPFVNTVTTAIIKALDLCM